MGCVNSQNIETFQPKQNILPPWMQANYCEQKEQPSLLQTNLSAEFIQQNDNNCENMQKQLFVRAQINSRNGSIQTQKMNLYDYSIDQSVQWQPSQRGSYSQSFHPIQTALDSTMSTIMQDIE